MSDVERLARIIHNFRDGCLKIGTSLQPIVKAVNEAGQRKALPPDRPARSPER